MKREYNSQPVKRRRKQRPTDARLLFIDAIEPITTSSLLTSGHINLAMELISSQFPLIGGLFCTTLGATLEYPAPQEDKWLQIVHDPNAKHWVVVAKGFFESELSIYDSLQFHPDSREHTVNCIRKLSPKSKSVIAKLCHKQDDDFSCGVFSLAFSIALVNNVDPSTLVFDDRKMRAHLIDCFNNRFLTPFPTTSSSKSTKSKRLNKVFKI